jgi:uncharacterized protein (DUF1778 family)
VNEPKKTKAILVRTSDEERAEIRRKAKEAKKTVSEYVRDSALGTKK